MKRIEETHIRGKSRKEVLLVGKKKFIRVASSAGVDWRRHKTNHQVKKVEFDNLEKEYKNTFPIHFSPEPWLVVPGVPVDKNKQKKVVLDIENTNDRRMIERDLLLHSRNGTHKLAGVKYVKNVTGLGLKDSKDFVFQFFERRDKYIEATKPIITKEDAKKKMIAFMRGDDSKLAVVKYVKEITGWGLKESKDFFEDYMRFLQAKKIVAAGF